jgi:hypothetical protein
MKIDSMVAAALCACIGIPYETRKTDGGAPPRS